MNININQTINNLTSWTVNLPWRPVVYALRVCVPISSASKQGGYHDATSGATKILIKYRRPTISSPQS